MRWNAASNDPLICSIVAFKFFSAFKAQANECAAMTKTNAVADI